MYEVWDGADCLGEFHTPGPALELIETLTGDDPSTADNLALFEIAANGSPRLIADRHNLTQDCGRSSLQWL